MVQRARIILLSADGYLGREVATRVGCSAQSVVAWRNRYEEEGLDGLEDRPRCGRPAQIDAQKRSEVVAKTLQPPPEKLGVTHWTSRLMEREVGLDHSTIARIWQDYDLQPWRTETFKYSTDPQLEDKVRDIVGLSMDPPENAVVVCVDEKSQIQALDRTQPMLPLRPGKPARHTHDSNRTVWPHCSRR